MGISEELPKLLLVSELGIELVVIVGVVAVRAPGEDDGAEAGYRYPEAPEVVEFFGYPSYVTAEVLVTAVEWGYQVAPVREYGLPWVNLVEDELVVVKSEDVVAPVPIVKLVIPLLTHSSWGNPLTPSCCRRRSDRLDRSAQSSRKS